MSSLGISLLLLLAVAVALAIGYNLRQGGWSRLWPRGRGFSGRVSGEREEGDAPGRREPAAAHGRRGIGRGEPRLGDGTPEAAEPAADNAARGPDPAASKASDGGAAGHRAQTGIATEAALTSTQDDVDPAPSAEAPETRAASGVDAVVPSAVDENHTPPAADGRRVPEERGGRDDPDSSDTPRDRDNPDAAAAGAVRAIAVPPPAAIAAPLLSEASDCVVELVPAAPLGGERLLAIAQRLRRAGSKPVAFDGSPQGAREAFEAPTPGRSYEIVRIGILLANRHGPLNAMEFSDFAGAVQAIAETLSAHVDMPAMGSVLARARDLDSTCAQLDVQIGVNVEASEAIEPAQLALLAQGLSLVERGSHRYVRQGPQGEPLFSLGFSDSPNRLTFLLDVPRVAASVEPFGRMVQAADACAQRLGARLVDDSGKPLTQASLAQIARQLAQRYESLEAIGLPAGSTLACKVFN